MNTTADTYYTCPKCGAAHSKLIHVGYSNPLYWAPETRVYKRICWECWHRWTPGEKREYHWTDAKGVLAHIRPGVPSEQLVRDIWEDHDE